MALIRPVKLSDAARILEIYAPHILDSAVSFETELPTLDEFRARIEEYRKKFPWLVYESENGIEAYVYASTHRARCAYGWSAECTVYVDPRSQGQGIGSRLYRELFQLIKAQGVVNVLAGITLPNTGSIAIHESLGFEPIGVYRDVGYKLSKWWDVGWWQLQLQKPAHPKALSPPAVI